MLHVKLHRQLRREQFVRQQERNGNDPRNAEFLGLFRQCFPVERSRPGQLRDVTQRRNLSSPMFSCVNAEHQHQILIAESAHFVSRHVDLNCPFEKTIDIESD
jgi:hypothetical protein